MTLYEHELKNAYIGEYIEPTAKTFTISWTEQSDMSSGWTYSDDASGLTAGSTEFDKFFGYSAVKLADNGTESSEVTQSSPGVLDITQLGTLTSGDNVMIKFPVRGIKMSKSGSVVTLSITDGIGRESEGYQYFAFQNTGDIEANMTTTVATQPLYLGAYISYVNGTKLQSWSGQSVSSGSYSITNCLTYSSNIGTGWTIMGFYQRMLIDAYYMMKYGNPNCQSVVGMGNVKGSSALTTGGTNSQTSATYGTSSNTTQIKLFGLEDWWGNQNQWIGGMFTASSKDMYVALHDFTNSMSTGQSQYKNAGHVSTGSSVYCLSSIVGTNTAMFAPNNTANDNDYATYYCDGNRVNGSKFARVGGHRTDNLGAGLFRMDQNFDASSAANWLGSRLMYL